LGGLIPLAALVSRALCRRDRRVAAAVQAISISFGNVALLAVGIIVISGISIAALVVSDATDLTTGNYAALLALKLVLFGFMLVVAGVNRFRLVPRLADSVDGSAVVRLWWSLLAEAILGLAVLIIAGALGIASPGADE
jgi:putative copper resistance protein D